MFSAASIVVMVPVVALFLYSSKWLVSGLTLGAVKG
jgi:arabinogalactan oligomer/maltooligosaccharide transport system permease protein